MRRYGSTLVLLSSLAAMLGAWLCGAAAAVEWTPPTPVPGSHGAVTSRVAISHRDVVAVAGEPAFVAIRLPEGRWLPVHRISAPNRIMSSVAIAFDARGRLFVAWAQAHGPHGAYSAPFEIRTQTWTRIRGWGSPHTLGRSSAFLLAQPRFALDARGDAIVFWRGLRRVGRHTREAVSSSFRPADGGWGPERQTPGGGPYRDVVLDAKGNAYAVWTTYAARNFFSMRPRRSARWGAARRLPGGPASLPTIAVTPRGAAVVAWRAAIVDSEGEGTQYGPVRAIVRLPDGTWGRAEALSGVRVHEVQAAVSPRTGAVLLTWGAPPANIPPMPGATDMRFSLFSGSGTTLSRVRAAPGTAAGPLAYRPNGDAIVVFGQELLEPGLLAGPIRFSALVPREPTFSEPVKIIARGRYPSLAGAPSDNGPVEAAMTYFDEAHERLALSLLERGPREPHS
ncbi:MAG TPA: hypothetical protein VN618_08015 [Solirubrobacteraceae bacterium]|nr:hypothetical protein [Solirubrobacteraceae bacterium]